MTSSFFKMALFTLFFILPVITKALSTCENGGIPKSFDENKGCYCGGTLSFGDNCSIPCATNSKPLVIPERCLDGSCEGRWGVVFNSRDFELFGLPSSCLDTRIPMNITRPSTFFSQCKIQPPQTETCIDLENTILINKTTIQEVAVRCYNGGILDSIDHGASCMCRGTNHHGRFCENRCDTFKVIPQACLNGGPCDIPESCIDVSRPDIVIDRCLHGGILNQGKTGTFCSCLGSNHFGDRCEKRCPDTPPPHCTSSSCVDRYPLECVYI